MGADLMGSIYFGPVNLKPRRITKAVKNYAALRKEAAEALLFTFDGPAVIENRFSKKLETALTYLRDWAPSGFGRFTNSDPIEESVEDLSTLQINLVEEIVNIWDNQPYRDQISRTLPKELFPKCNYKTVVAAFTSWGDGADINSAQSMLELAYGLGILEDLGIR